MKVGDKKKVCFQSADPPYFLAPTLHFFSLCESLYFSQDNLSGKILHLTRPHQALPDWSVLIKIKKVLIFHQTTGPVCGFFSPTPLKFYQQKLKVW